MSEIDRTEKLLALILLQGLKGAAQRDKALCLNVAGFSNVEIADLLQTTPALIAQSLYEARRGSKKPAKKRRASR